MKFVAFRFKFNRNSCRRVQCAISECHIRSFMWKYLLKYPLKCIATSSYISSHLMFYPVNETLYGVIDSPRSHGDVIKWKHFPRYWLFVRGIHRSSVNSPHKGQWRGDLMFSLICAWINGWVNNHEAGGLRRYHAHYDVTVMLGWKLIGLCT